MHDEVAHKGLRRSRPSAISALLQSGYALVLGLLVARWGLQVLGHVGYGLYGVVGGLTVLIPFLLLHPISPIPNTAPSGFVIGGISPRNLV